MHPFSIDALDQFNEANHAYCSFALMSRKSYERGLIAKLREAPKLFHSYIRLKKVGRPSIGPLRLPGEGIISDGPRICEVFAEAYASVFVDEIPEHPVLAPPMNMEMAEFQFSEEAVRQALQSLCPQSAAGLDNIHPRLLKSCAATLAYPLYIIFQKSLLGGQLPSDWKESVVTPIFKSKTRSDPLNYRPVSLTSVVCCKTMERLLSAHIMDYLETNSIIKGEQFGFRRGRSTEDQLLLTYASISRLVDAGMLVDLVLLDFNKAFDVVDHLILTRQLLAIGISQQVVRWVVIFGWSYYTGSLWRTQKFL